MEEQKVGGEKEVKNFYTMDNNIFNLGLDAYEFQIYSYLVSCAGKDAVCWPSLNTIAGLLGMSTNTVIRKIDSLIRKGFIEKEGTTSLCKNGKIRTSNNRYYIQPFEEVWDRHFRFNPVGRDNTRAG